MSVSEDPIVNAVYGGIKTDIEHLLSARRFRGALILIYAGIDSMAYLRMNPNKEEVDRADFVEWAERYVRFQGSEQLNGLDLYGARCSLLHQYSVFSRLSKEGKCRIIGYADHMESPVRYDPSKSERMVMVSVQHLAEAFFRGIDQFLVDAFSDPNRKPLIEKRLRQLIVESPFDTPESRNS